MLMLALIFYCNKAKLPKLNWALSLRLALNTFCSIFIELNFLRARSQRTRDNLSDLSFEPILVLQWANREFTLSSRFCMPKYTFHSIFMELVQAGPEISSPVRLWAHSWSYSGPQSRPNENIPFLVGPSCPNIHFFDFHGATSNKSRNILSGPPLWPLLVLWWADRKYT